MYCKFCGRQIADDSKFCEFCGNLVQNENHEAPADIGAPIFKDVILPEPTADETVVFTPPDPSEAVEEEGEMPEELEDLEDIIPKTHTPPKSPRKKLGKGAIAGMVVGGIALIGIIALIVFMATRKPAVRVDVTEYVDFKISGYDGYGVATCEIDWTGLQNEALGIYPIGSDSKAQKKQAEYREKIAVLRSAITIKFERKENVSVGDVLTAEIQINKTAEADLNVTFSANTKASYTVQEKDLNGSTAFEFTEEFLDLSVTGLSGQGKAELAIKKRDKAFSFTTYDGAEYTVSAAVESADKIRITLTNTKDQSYETVDIGYQLDKTTEIANGDKIHLTLDEDAETALMDYGLSLSGRTKEFTAEKLNTLAATPENINDAVLSGWIEQYGGLLREMVLRNWAHYIHAGNQVETGDVVLDFVEPVDQAIQSNGESNTLYLIYSAMVADDAILLAEGEGQTMYFAVKLENLILDSEGKLLTDQVVLPELNQTDYLGAYADLDTLNRELLGASTR